MNRQDYIQKCSNYLGRLAYEIKASNASGLFDINTIAEDFFIPILSIICECPDLKNQNRVKMNFPSVDLGCDTSKISIQVTSDNSSSKITETLKKFHKHKLESQFDTVFIFVITEKQSSYSSKKLIEQIQLGKIGFSIDEHIIDYRDISSKLNSLSDVDLEKIHSILEAEFSKKESHLKFLGELNAFLEFGKSKIEVEKKTKKYIPSIFVETSSIKDEVRLFSHPVFFQRKVDDVVKNIDYDQFNELLKLAGAGKLKFHKPSMASEPNTMRAAYQYLEQRKSEFLEIKNLVAPYSWRRDVPRYEPKAENENKWDVFRYPIEANGSGIDRKINDALKSIEIIEAKVFLITGMAGQGKTNFVCDLVDNLYRVFEIPSIFIPARDLNHFSSPDRIFNFIKNNRYAPNVQTLHDLLELLNGIAEEHQKPFIIAIDGINEVSELSQFNAELKAFLGAVCQYDFVKVVLTCRNEFFDQRFASILDEDFSNKIYRVQDLRSEMSDRNLERLLRAYFNHFSISLNISSDVEEFLKSDLILLRIFCEINEGQGGKSVTSIYKGDIFEKYLLKKASEFPVGQQKLIVGTLHKIASIMLDLDEYTKLSTSDFQESEFKIIERLISEDIVLRREVPPEGISDIGSENISFTYDELRDFIIAHFIENNLSRRDIPAVESIMTRLPSLPVYEGVFRYLYILARQNSNNELSELCEKDPNFIQHYIDNLDLLPIDIQTDKDVVKVREVLANITDKQKLRSVGVFLYHRRGESELLNIGILIEHISALADDVYETFISAIFSSMYDFGDKAWRGQITNLLGNFLSGTDERIFSIDNRVVAFLIQISSFAEWQKREEFYNRVGSLRDSENIGEAIFFLKSASSSIIKRALHELESSKKVDE